MGRNRLLVFLIFVLVIAGIGNLAVVGASGVPQLYPSASCGQAGDIVVVEGKGFTPNGLVDITWSGMALGTEPYPVQTGPDGRLHFQFIVPNDHQGPHPVRAADSQGTAEFTFDLGAACLPPATAIPPEPGPSPTFTPTPLPPTPAPDVPRLVCEQDGVPPDTTLQVSGENFHPGVPIYQVRWDSVVIPWLPAGLTVGDNGKFTLSVVAPSDTYEIHTLVVADGQGEVAACYVNLVPRDPTPTPSPTATLTPTPSPTWTPGPPPGITVTPTAIPGPGAYCAAIEAAFSRYPLVHSQIDAGLTVTNLNQAWPAGEVQLRIWQYYNMFEWDTGISQGLPALNQGETMPVHLRFTSPQSGPTWFQVRLHELVSGRELPCPSAWYPLNIIEAAPYPPALVKPPDNVWLNSRQLTLDWLPAEASYGAAPAEQYELQLADLGTGELLAETTAGSITDFPHTLTQDYGARQLTWRARASNPAGWGMWATALYFGVDTVRPVVEMTLAGDECENGWWCSPVTVRVGGSDPAPGSGVQATYLQLGEAKWAQVIPGGANTVDQEGTFDLRAYSRDWAHNRSPVIAQPVKIDLNPPYQVGAHFSLEPTASGWYTQAVTVSVEAEDAASGVAERLIRLDGGAWRNGTATVDAEGPHLVEFLARDLVGHETSPYQTTAKLDLTPPSGVVALNGSLCQTCSPAEATIAAGDDESGLGHWTLALVLPQTNQATSSAGTVMASGNEPSRNISLDGGALPVGTLTLRLTVQDKAGWVTTEELVVVNAPATPGPTPTPWFMPTATPWPAATAQPVPATPTPGQGGQDDKDDDDDGGGSGNGGGTGGGTSGGGGYPVGGGVVVPAILPVTGGAGLQILGTER